MTLTSSGDLCDPDEVCPGVADEACPADTITPAGTICNPGSGDLCDLDEVCSGTADEPCPADSFEPTTTECRPSGTGDEVCDPPENCPGTADEGCPDDSVAPRGTPCDDLDECTSFDGELGDDACDGNGVCLGTDVLSTINVLKLTQSVVNPNMSWTFTIHDGPNMGENSSFLGNSLGTDSTSGDADGVLDFDGINLDPDKTYTLCERDVPAGWSSFWQVDTTGDGNPDTVLIPYNPNANDPVPSNIGNRCVDIGFNTPFELPCGEILNFEVNNTFPGGDQRTPGYWKNWNICTSGGQTKTAARNGGPAEGWFILDDILNDPGIVWGDFAIVTCEDGVSILDQRDLNSGRKRASDAAYTLAMHLLAAQLNFAAGAETCQEAQDAAVAAENLLVSIGFDGTGKYLRPKDALFSTALELAETLDTYNNGLLCD